jgi:ribulose-5-phosphate 4-epimerase/fuculose-1-phosphate aldolase
MNSKKELVECLKNLYWMGLTTSVSGNHSVRFRNRWMWITPSGISRYNIHSNHLVKVHLKTSKVFGSIRPSIELNLHRNIYNSREDVNAIVHTHSPFTIGVSISSRRFLHVIEEAKIVVGQPVIIPNKTLWFKGSCRICIYRFSEDCYQSSNHQKPRRCCSRQRHSSSARCSRIAKGMGKDTNYIQNIWRS